MEDSGIPMKIVTYRPEHFELLQQFCTRAEASPAMRSRAFVGHYYGPASFADLFIALDSEGAIVGTLGVERMSFEYRGTQLVLGLGSSYRSLSPGAGGFLLLHWLRSYPGAMVYGGTEATYRILQRGEWIYCHGIQRLRYDLPRRIYPSDSPSRRLVKRLIRWTYRGVRGGAPFRPVAESLIPSGMEVVEEKDFSEDLLPRRSSFEFRFTPTVDHLRWRYALDLPFVRYRLFRILEGGKTRGYVVLRSEDGGLAVAQSDAEDPRSLLSGILLAAGEIMKSQAETTWVQLNSCHHWVNERLEWCGFLRTGEHRLAVAGAAAVVGRLPDTANWLVSLDWGDNGLTDELNAQPGDGSALR